MRKFEQTILNFLKEHALLSPGDRVLVACSGGVDSVALLGFIATYREQLGVEVAAVQVDHMLRGEESAADGVFVEVICKRYGIPFFGGSVPVPTILDNEGGNVQAICRAGRYALFAKVMKEQRYNVLVTAHHAEDQLETVLMQLTKGSRPSGIPTKREIEGGILIRPFLPVMKAELVAYVAEHNLAFREDPSNESDAYMRNRFRRHVVPFILAENRAAARNAVEMTHRLRDDEELLESLVQERFKQIVQFDKKGLPFIENNAFFAMHPALQRRMIPLLLNYLYISERVPVEYNNLLIEQLLHHLDSNKGNVSLNLPRGFQFVLEYGKLTFVRSEDISEPLKPIVLRKGVWTSWGEDTRLYWNEVEERYGDAVDGMYFNLPDDALPLSVKLREDGDRMLLRGMSQPKRLSRLFIDEKVIMTERDRLPVVITAQGEVCAVPGVRYGVPFSKIRTNHEKYIFIVEKV